VVRFRCCISDISDISGISGISRIAGITGITEITGKPIIIHEKFKMGPVTKLNAL
jgi:hypothetical protein